MQKFALRWGLFLSGYVVGISIPTFLSIPLYLWARSLGAAGRLDCVDPLPDQWLLSGGPFACSLFIVNLLSVVYRAKLQHAHNKTMFGKDPNRLAADITPAALAKQLLLYLLGAGLVIFAVPVYRKLMSFPVLLVLVVAGAVAHVVGVHLMTKAQLPENRGPVTPPTIGVP